MSPIKRVIFSFLTWRILLLVLILAGLTVFKLNPNFLAVKPQVFERFPLLWAHANYDGNNYISIAQSGYGYKQQPFFPLYPYLIRKLNPYFFNHPAFTGIIISNISFFFALIYLYKLLSIDYDQSSSLRTILLLLVFPTSFFFSGVYTESLFLLLVVASFYYARTDRWFLSGILGALATGTRFVGIFLLPALIVEFIVQKKSLRKPQALFLLIIPLGLFYYMGYLQKTTGDPLAFIHYLKDFGPFRSEKIILLYQVFWRYVKMILTVNRNDPLYHTIVLESLTGVIFLVTSALSLKVNRLSYTIFNFLTYIIPTLTGSFVGLPRYVLVCFPSFMVLSHYLKNHKYLFRIVYIISAAGLFYFWLRFSRSYWVA